MKTTITCKGHMFTAAVVDRALTIADGPRLVVVGRWDDEDGILVDPPVALMPDADDSEDAYAAIERAIRIARLPS